MGKKITFDYWEHLYSKRTKGMVSSEIRDILSFSARPDIISFAGGNPEVRALNIHKLEKYVKRTVLNESEINLQYGNSNGYYPLKTRLLEVMRLENIEANEEDLVITTGGQQALDLIAKIFINTGDIIIVESPSYTGALNSFNAYEANIIGIPIDENGIKVELLEEKLKELREKNMQVKFIYLVPNFSNPSGVTLSLDRRKKILDLAAKNNTLIIEDNPYGMLRYEGEAITTLKELDIAFNNRNVIYISTLSKLFAPGFRIGWIMAPHLILEKLALGIQSSILCPSSFSQRIAFEYFSDPSWKNNITEFIKIYSDRRNTMLDALEKYFPEGTSWSRPAGGFFIWLKMHDFLNSRELLAEAVRNKVAFVPGAGFYPDNRGFNEARLAFCSEDTSNIEKGIKILADIIKDKIKLYKSFK